MEIVELTSATWAIRKRSNIVKWLMERDRRTPQEMANALGVSLGYFNNKLTRNSWSIDDIYVLAKYCRFSLALIDETTKQSYDINLGNDDTIAVK